MEIEINNCNNIDKGSIMIYENQLNIKYAINGTGKSTISKAIELSINGSSSNDINNLKPFKYRNQEGYNSEIKGLENINTIAIFNEEYVKQYVFLQDELIKNSFDIFIRNDKYNEGMKQIDDMINIIGKMFDNNKEINLLFDDLNRIVSFFSLISNVQYGHFSDISKNSLPVICHFSHLVLDSCLINSS